jgi:hypothetical protein
MTPDLARSPNRAHDTDTIADTRWYTTLPKPNPVAVSDAGGPNSPIANCVNHADFIESDWASRHGYPCRTS